MGNRKEGVKMAKKECEECFGNGSVTLYAGNVGGGKPANIYDYVCKVCKGAGEVNV